MKRRNETFSQALVGVFMVTVLLLLGYFTIVISGFDMLAGRDRVPVRITFESVGGLKERDNVMYRGTKVGIVDRVVVTETNLVVVAMIDPKVVLRKGCAATVCNMSMLGGYYLSLEEGEGERLSLTDTVFAGTTPTDWMKDVAKIARNINSLTSRPELDSIVTNFNEIAVRIRSIASKAEAVMDRIERGEGTVGRLLSSDASLYDDLRAATADAKGMVASATKAFDGISRVTDSVGDEKTIEDLKGGIAAFRKAAESFDGKDLVASAKDLVAGAKELAANLNTIAVKIRDGEGTLGRLANDSSMYDELNALIKDCRQVLDNYRDTTPIATFSSLATGAL